MIAFLREWGKKERSTAFVGNLKECFHLPVICLKLSKFLYSSELGMDRKFLKSNNKTKKFCRFMPLFGHTVPNNSKSTATQSFREWRSCLAMFGKCQTLAGWSFPGNLEQRFHVSACQYAHTPTPTNTHAFRAFLFRTEWTNKAHMKM